MFDAAGKVAVVTGASRGIGKSIAVALGKCGATVIGVDITSMDDTGSVVSENGGVFLPRIMDVTDKDAVQELAARITKEHGAVSYLVNNAGITRDNLILRMKQEEWDQVINVDLRAVFLITQACIRPMMKARFGRIVNIASVIGLMGNAGQANYAAAKGGLIAFTKSVAKELAGRGITANALAPGFIETGMTAVLDDTVQSQYLKSIPLGRFGSPDDVANAVLFFCSPWADYITGQVINVDGGLVM